MYKQATADFATSSLNGAMTAVATTATIGTGINIPATLGILQIDYDSAIAVGTDNGPETISYAAYTTATGALTGITRGLAGTTGVAHDNGKSVQSAPSSLYGTDFVGARAYLNATLGTTVDSVWTKIALDAETYDVGANFASNKFTAPVNGYYQVSWCVAYDNAVSTKLYSSGIYVDGTKVAQVDNTNSTITGLSCAGSDVIYMAATSYVELYYYQASGATTVDIFRGPEGTYMTVTLLKEV
jgi:hypothetical protein